ncbi:MAG: hypothetical protein KFF49_05520 [Bacteroidales bacterium]|nr:hypothetical protein [Bacteroidales bacterium]
MIKKRIIVFLSALSLLSLPVHPQSLLDSLRSDTDSQAERTVLFMGTMVHSGQSTETPAKGELLLNIQHRFGDITNGIYDFFGLDVATMRLGFEYGFNDWLSASIGRSTFEKTYDLGIKAKLMSQDNAGQALAISVFAQASKNSLRNIYPEDYDNLAGRMSYYGQLILGRNIGLFSLQISPVILYNAYDYRISDSFLYYALGFAGSIKVSDRLSITGEYFHGLKDLPLNNYNPLSIGVDIDTGGHLFQLMFSNSTGMFNKALLSNNTGSWSGGDIYFGFNLIRTFY